MTPDVAIPWRELVCGDPPCRVGVLEGATEDLGKGEDAGHSTIGQDSRQADARFFARALLVIDQSLVEDVTQALARRVRGHPGPKVFAADPMHPNKLGAVS